MEYNEAEFGTDLLAIEYCEAELGTQFLSPQELDLHEDALQDLADME